MTDRHFIPPITLYHLLLTMLLFPSTFLQVDVVYTSWLSRAIETAWMVMNELEDSLWVPIVKSWRLNERMYGELTGLSKKMIR